MHILEEERILADVEFDKKIDVRPHPPFMSKQQKKAAKERAEQRFGEDKLMWQISYFYEKQTQPILMASLLKDWSHPHTHSLLPACFRLREFELQRVQHLGNQNRCFSGQFNSIKSLLGTSYYLMIFENVIMFFCQWLKVASRSKPFPTDCPVETGPSVRSLCFSVLIHTLVTSSVCRETHLWHTPYALSLLLHVWALANGWSDSSTIRQTKWPLLAFYRGKRWFWGPIQMLALSLLCSQTELGMFCIFKKQRQTSIGIILHFNCPY